MAGVLFIVVFFCVALWLFGSLVSHVQCRRRMSLERAALQESCASSLDALALDQRCSIPFALPSQYETADHTYKLSVAIVDFDGGPVGASVPPLKLLGTARQVVCRILA